MIRNNTQDNLKVSEANNHLEENATKKNFFLRQGVKQNKNALLKARLRTLIYARGMNEAEFYHSIGLGKQYWYEISWGIWDCPDNIKVKIAQALETDSCVIWRAEE